MYCRILAGKENPTKKGFSQGQLELFRVAFGHLSNPHLYISPSLENSRSSPPFAFAFAKAKERKLGAGGGEGGGGSGARASNVLLTL